MGGGGGGEHKVMKLQMRGGSGSMKKKENKKSQFSPTYIFILNIFSSSFLSAKKEAQYLPYLELF